MTTTEPTEPQTADDKPRRLTVAEVATLAQKALTEAENALALTSDSDAKFEDIGEKLGDLTTRLNELRENGPGLPSNLLSRLESAERKLAEGGSATSDEFGPFATRVNSEMDTRFHAMREELQELGATLVAEIPQVIDTRFHAMVAEIPQVIDSRMRAAITEMTDLGPVRELIDSRLQEALSLGYQPRDNSDLPYDPPPVSAGRGAALKVLKLMRQVEVIGKEREAVLGDRGGRFQFRGIDQAMDAVGHAMRSVGLVLTTEVVSKNFSTTEVINEGTSNGSAYRRTILWTSAQVHMRYRFVDPEDGSEHAFEMVGEGRDNSDKATSKAVSMALKYGLFQALMIPVSEMADGDADSPMVVHERQPDRTATPAPHVEQQRPAPVEPAPQADPPPTQPSGASRVKRAHDALTAMRNLDNLDPAQRAHQLAAIRTQIEQEGLGTVEVDGASLRAHGAAVAATLGSN